MVMLARVKYVGYFISWMFQEMERMLQKISDIETNKMAEECIHTCKLDTTIYSQPMI